MVRFSLSEKWQEFVKTVGVYILVLSAETLWICFLLWLVSNIPVIGIPLVLFIGTISVGVLYYLITLVYYGYKEWQNTFY